MGSCMIALFVVTMFTMEKIHALDANSIAVFSAFQKYGLKLPCWGRNYRLDTVYPRQIFFILKDFIFFLQQVMVKVCARLNPECIFTLSLDDLISQWIHWSHKWTSLTCEEWVPGFNFYLSILLSCPHQQCYLEKLLACTRIARITQQMSLDSLPDFTKCFHFNMVASPDVFINA